MMNGSACVRANAPETLEDGTFSAASELFGYYGVRTGSGVEVYTMARGCSFEMMALGAVLVES